MSDCVDHDQLDVRVRSLVEQRRFAEYVELSRGLVDQFPDDPRIRLHYGRALGFMPMQREESVEQLRLAVEAAPEDPQLLTLAASLMFQAGEFDVAQDYVGRAQPLVQLSTFPYGADLVNLAGLLAEIQGDYERAETLLRAALDAHPSDLTFARSLARFLRDRGDTVGAAAVVNGALVHHPEDEQLLSILD